MRRLKTQSQAGLSGFAGACGGLRHQPDAQGRPHRPFSPPDGAASRSISLVGEKNLQPRRVSLQNRGPLTQLGVKRPPTVFTYCTRPPAGFAGTTCMTTERAVGASWAARTRRGATSTCASLPTFTQQPAFTQQSAFPTWRLEKEARKSFTVWLAALPRADGACLEGPGE